MTIVSPVASSEADFQIPAVDLYRDIHKGIRAELFAVTAAAGSIDPDDRGERRAHATRVQDLVDLLEHHAGHEDSNIDPVLAGIAPAISAEISVAHAELDSRISAIAELAGAALADSVDGRTGSHALYLELAAFTAMYLQHQDYEERVVMRVLDEHLSFPELLQLHEQILASVQPDVMVRCASLMLPAMNIVDRCEMLGAMRDTAPGFVFAGMWDLAGSVLSTRQYLATAHRLGLAVDPAKIA
jgi:hypothetical protein